MIRKNYHSHTKRCGHAAGEDEEYVLAAIEAGLSVLGFSDHAPYRTSAQGLRMDMEQKQDYLDSVNKLKIKYKDQITILRGMEIEYCPGENDEELKEYRNTLDYMVLGQHVLSMDGFSAYDIRTPEQLDRYVALIEEACRKGLCEYVCHPDVCMWSYECMDEHVRSAAARLASVSVELDIPMEINCGSGVHVGERPYRDGVRFPYPTHIFFEEFAKAKAPVIIGLDAHEPRMYLTDEYINRALSIVKDLDLNLVQDFDMLKAAEKHRRIFNSAY